MTYTETVTSLANLVASRTDTVGATNSNTTVGDVNAVATDLGKAITGAGIPAGTSITAVTPGTGYTISQAATATATGVSLTIFQQIRAIAGRTGFVRVYDPTLGTVAASYSTAWNSAAHSYNLPAVNTVTMHAQYDDAAPWYGQGGGTTAGAYSGSPDGGTPQVGEIDVTLTVASGDTVNAASVQTFHGDANTLVVVATGL